MTEMYAYVCNETLAPETAMTPSEAAYLASGGKSVQALLEENGRHVAPDGTIGFLTRDGRVVSGRDYVGGFCFGDIVRLHSGGPRMTVVEGGSHHVVCDYFNGSDRKQERFRPVELQYLGRPEDFPLQMAGDEVISIQVYRTQMLARGHTSRAFKEKKVRARRAA